MLGEYGNLFYFILFATPQAIIIIASSRYLAKYKVVDAYLLLIGSIISFLNFTFSSFFYQYYYSSDGFDTFQLEWINLISGLVGAAGTFLFAIGVLMLINKLIRNKLGSNEVDQIGKG
jgi:hypothetical protein